MGTGDKTAGGDETEDAMGTGDKITGGDETEDNEGAVRGDREVLLGVCPLCAEDI